MEHFLAKIVVGLLVIAGFAGFCWGVLISPNAPFFVSMTALVLSLFNTAAVMALWVFYLAKQFSTHKVQVLDLQRSAKQRKPVTATAPLEDDEEDEFKTPEDKANEFAERAVAKMFNRTKEYFDDSLS